MTGRRLRSRIAWSDRDRIVVRGMDLATELIGKVSLGQMAFLELRGRLPTEPEARAFEAIVVTLVEHGMTPSAIAARMTLLGAPEALQGAIAAGILGLGDRFGGPVEDVARMLQEAPAGEDAGLVAAATVAEFRAAGRLIPGVGHPIHTAADPRVPALFQVAEETGFSGRHVELMKRIGEEARRATGKKLPLNATAAIGAIASELEIPWRSVRGLAVMARAIGLVAHLQEEHDDPMASEIWNRVEEEATRDARRS